MNLAFLVYDISSTGGAEAVLKNLADEFIKKHKVTIISIFASQNFKKTKEISYIVLSNKYRKIPLHICSFSKMIKNVLKQNDTDILFSITAGVNTLAVLSIRGTRTKLVYCEHSNLENKTYGYKHQLRQKLGAKHADVVVTLTERDRGNFIRTYKLDSKKVIAIPNWFIKNEKTTTTNENNKKIISVGRLEYVKGFDNLIHIAKLVKEKHPDWHWDIYGDGSYHENLIKLAEAFKVDDFVSFKGNSNSLNSLYSNYDIMAMTSYYEGFPLSLLEGKTHNLPIVSFDCPTGPSEIITDGVDGFLINCYNTSSFAEKINYLIEHKEIRNNMCKNAQKVLSKFEKEKILIKWEGLINDLK